MNRNEIIDGLRAEINRADWTGDRFLDLVDVCVLRAALEELEAQEPRVMTLEDARKTMRSPAWLETKSRSEMLYVGWVLLYDIQKGLGITGERLGMTDPSRRVHWYKLGDYGVTWRLWTSRPTDEQREATPWET